MLHFFHFLGFALWMGGGWSVMSLVMTARRDTAATRAGLFRILPAAYTTMSIGALVTLASGLGLAMRLVRAGAGFRMGEPGIILMQTTGLLGVILLLVLGAPTSRKLAKLAATEPLPENFERLRKRLAAVSSIGGVLALLALIGATLL